MIARFAACLALLWLPGLVVAEPDPELEPALQLLKAKSIGTDGPELLRFFRERTLTEADRARLVVKVRQLGDDDFDVRDRASADLLKAGRVTLPLLRRATTDTDPERSRRAR